MGQNREAIPLPTHPLELDETLLKGIYTNTFYVTSSQSETTIDFSLQTVAHGESERPKPRNIHVARVTMSLRAARLLRDLLVSHVPDEQVEQTAG